MYTAVMKTIKLYSGQNPLNGHRLIQTPYYYGKLALSLGKSLRRFYLNSTRTNTSTFRYSPSVALSVRINED